MKPDAELQLQPSPSLMQLEAIRSGRLDAGFVFNVPKADPELDRLAVTVVRIELAVPADHPLTQLKVLCLRDLRDAPVCLVSKAGKPGALRPTDARMRFRGDGEVRTSRSGGTRRGNNPKPRCERLGRGVGHGNGTVAASRKCCHHARGRFELAAAVGSRLEKGQQVPFACRVRRRSAALLQRAGGQQGLSRLTQPAAMEQATSTYVGYAVHDVFFGTAWPRRPLTG